MNTTKSPKQRILNLLEDLVYPGPSTNKMALQDELNKLLDSKPILTKFFFVEVKRCLSIKMEDQYLYNLFALVEGASSKCSLHFQKELNNTAFLDLLLTKLKSSKLNDKAEKKLLGLFKLWHAKYGSQGSSLANLRSYYERLMEENYSFPEPRRYSLNLPLVQSKKVKLADTNNQISFKEIVDIDTSFLCDNHKIHFEELVFILKKTTEANKLIDGPNCQETKKAISNLTAIEDTIRFLPKKFKDSEDCLLYKLSTAILKDIGASRMRYGLACKGLSKPHFASRAVKVLLNFKSKTIDSKTPSYESDSDKDSSNQNSPKEQAEGEFCVKKYNQSNLLLSGASDKEFFETKENFELRLGKISNTGNSVLLKENDIGMAKSQSIGKFNTADMIGSEDLKSIDQESRICGDGRA